MEYKFAKLTNWKFQLAEVAPYSFELVGFKDDLLRMKLYGHDDAKLLEAAKIAAMALN